MKLKTKTISTAMILSLLLTPAVFTYEACASTTAMQGTSVDPLQATTTTKVAQETDTALLATQQQLAEQETMSLLWMKTAAEYRALAYQTYNIASMEIDKSITNHKSSDKPLAIILDCDETVVSNIDALSQEAAKGNGQYRAPWWRKTVHDTTAYALPGAREFLQATADKGVAIYYVSNRYEPVNLEPTLKALQTVQFPQIDKEHVLLMKDSSDKQLRFNQILETHDVILYVGDNYGDFPLPKSKTIEERNKSIDDTASEWGSKFIMLPNPVYGSWVSALSKEYLTMSTDERNVLVKNILQK